MSDWLDLDGIETEEVQDLGPHGLMVTARTVEPVFPSCEVSPMLCRPVERGGGWLRVADLPRDGRATVVRVWRRTARCALCRHEVAEVLPGIHEGAAATRRLLAHVGSLCMVRRYAEVAREVRLPPAVVRDAFHAFVDERVEALGRRTPKVLGIAGAVVAGRSRAVVGNVELGTVLNVLPDRDGSLRRWLRALPDKRRVETVVTDMHEGTRLLVRAALPGRVLLVDPAYAERRAREALDEWLAGLVREGAVESGAQDLRRTRALFLGRSGDLGDEGRAAVDGWRHAMPLLREAFDAKEAYLDLFACRTPEEATDRFRAWLRGLSPRLTPFFADRVAVEPSWEPHVLSSIGRPAVEGFARAVEALASGLRKDGRGVPFEVTRAKLLLSSRLESTTYRERDPRAPATSYPHVPEPSVDARWGVDLRRLGDVVGARLLVLRRASDRWWREDRSLGLTTLEADWMEAA